MAEFREEPTAAFWTPTKARWAVAAVLGLYLAGVSGQWYLTPDSSRYLLLGQSLADGGGYAIFGQPHGKFPPGFPLWIASLVRLGLGELLWLNLAMATAGLATLVVAYRLLLRLTTPAMAASVTLAVALSYEMYGASFRQLSDVPFMLLVLLGLWGYVTGARGSRWALLAGTAALVACCWMRVVGFPLAIAAAVGLIVELRRDAPRAAWLNVGLLAMGLAVSAAWMLVQDRASKADGVTASYSSEVELLTRRSPLWRVAAPVVNLYRTGPEVFRLASGQTIPAPLALVVLVVPLAVGTVREAAAGRWIVALAVLGYIGGILLFRPLLARYLLPVAPLLYLYFVSGCRQIAFWLLRWPDRWVPAATIAAAIIVAMNVPKDIRLAVAVHRPHFENFRDGWPELYDAARAVRLQSGPHSRFVATEYETIVAYLSGVPCYQVDRTLLMSRPTDEQLREQLAAAGIDSVLLAKKESPRPYFARLETLLVQTDPAGPLHENRKYSLYGIAPTRGAGVGDGAGSDATFGDAAALAHPDAADPPHTSDRRAAPPAAAAAMAQ